MMKVESCVIGYSLQVAEEEVFVKMHKKIWPGSGGAHLLSQHLGGRDRRISEFEASQVYKVSSRTAKAIEKPCLQKQKNNNNKKKI